MNLQALQKITYGMYIVSSFSDEKINACLVNTVFQITSEPAIIAVSVNKQNLTHNLIEQSKIFTVSVLNQDADMKFIGNFGFRSGRDIDKFSGISHKTGLLGCPIVLDNTAACFETKVVKIADMGKHSIFFGQIENTEILNEKTPMTYSYYHEVIKGKTAKNAPTYINPLS
jgi:ferric-chelate reductase [NAD(P)H]